MTEYAEGTVAVATVRGVPGVRVFRTASSTDDSFSVWRHAEVKGRWLTHPGEVADVRPLVVLDLKAANPHGVPSIVLENLLSTLRNSEYLGCEGVADQIEAQTKPPRIPEPGKYGVVKARTASLNRLVQDWVSEGKLWRGLDTGTAVDWADLLDPVLVREGVDG